MSLNIKREIHELLNNQHFVEWVLNPSSENDNYWKDYLFRNPQMEGDVKEARTLVKAISKKEKLLSGKDVVLLWNRIENSVSVRSPRRIYFTRWSVAAGITLLVGLVSSFLYFSLKQVPEVDYSSIARIEPSNDVTLFLADSTKETFSSDQVEIKYNEPGKIITGTGKVLCAESTELSQKEEEQFNQLVVPYGKHSHIILSDGTKLWLNSGSRAIYPVAFTKKVREIYIEGEAYMEVTHNEKQPFFVKTNDLKVRVLGTKFNVSAYADDKETSVVLVEGSVEAISKEKEAVIKPNQMFAVEKNTGIAQVRRANVMEYISWKEGWLFCNRESMASIAAKISRYYDIHIELKDAAVSNLTLSGKLDLKPDYKDVFKSIASTAPILYEIVDSTHVKISRR